MQLRSLLDTIGQSPDDSWAELLESDALLDSADTPMAVHLPSPEHVEGSLLDAVDALGEALEGDDGFRLFFKRCGGWPDAEAYFGEMGSHHIMFVDVDNNDLDDRLAIILLAFQLASANAERRLAHPRAEVVLLLDGRAWEASQSLVLWRTMRLAWVLDKAVGNRHGLAVRVVVGDAEKAAKGLASYLGMTEALDTMREVLEAALPGASADFYDPEAAREGQSSNPGPFGGYGTLLPRGSKVCLWILSGMCDMQVQDVMWLREECGAPIRVFEQAQPAWQSVDVSDAVDAVQPHAAFPPVDTYPQGYGAEPSNVRAGEEPYPAGTRHYLRLQHVLMGGRTRVDYVVHALAREGGFMPVPPGRPMVPVSGRPFNVLPGEEYCIKRALDPSRASASFSRMMAAAKGRGFDELHSELSVSCEGDDGEIRESLRHMERYGTYMSDAVTVVLSATFQGAAVAPEPEADTQAHQQPHQVFLRRLALLRV